MYKRQIYDPWVDADEAKREYGITPIPELNKHHYDAIILAVAHDDFVTMGADAIRQLGKPDHILYDIKSVLHKNSVDARL